jgi:hypothetical protein
MIGIQGGPRVGAQAPANDYVCFPTCTANDARFLVVAGNDPTTLGGVTVLIRLAAPLTADSVTFGIFDGDRISGSDIPAGNWDITRLGGGVPTGKGSPPHLLLELFADPNGTGPDSPGAVLVQTWSGQSTVFPNNGWLDLAVPNDPAALTTDRFQYALRISAVDPDNNQGWNAFKIRTTGTVALTPQAFAFLASLNAPGVSDLDARVVYPNFVINTPSTYVPTTYDGTWRFAFSVPDNTPHLTIWDGDMDYGDRTCTYMDTNDPDSPLFPPFDHPNAAAQGVAKGIANAAAACGPNGGFSTGDPNEDTPTTVFTRKPTRLGSAGILYEIVDPFGVGYLNANPSGNREWEQFKITQADDANPAQLCLGAGDPDRVNTDCKAVDLPEGVYLVNIDGMDLNNLNFWHFDYAALGLTISGTPVCEDCFYRIGRLVWYDPNRNGIQDPGEPGIAGVTVTVTDGQGRIQTGVTDAHGEFYFRKPAGTYTVKVDDSNFSGPLAGLTSTVPWHEVKTGVTVGPPDYAEAVFGYAPPPPATSCVAISAVQGVAITPVTLTPSGGTGPPYTFTANGLPAGLTMSSTGTISGTPTVSGAFSYTVTVTDKNGNSSSVNCLVTVAPPPSANCVTITAVQGVAITPVTVTGSGGAGQPYSFAASGLPAGLSMASDGTISGTPTASGVFNYTITVTDKNGNTGTTSCSVTVNAPPTTDCVTIPATQGVPITPVNLTATGGTGAPYTFSATGLPAGVTISSGGTISGTPTVNGSFNYTVTVKDKDGNTGTKGCSVTVAPPPVGSFRTQTQGGWGAKPSGNNPGALLANNFGRVYPGGVQIGGTRWLRFTSAAAVQNFLPQGGTAAALTASATNPVGKLNVLAGQVLALELSVDFSNTGVTRVGLGALRVKSGKLAGYTVSQVLALANSVLGGGAVPAGLSISDINGVVDAINNNFDDGTVDRGYLQ